MTTTFLSAISAMALSAFSTPQEEERPELALEEISGKYFAPPSALAQAPTVSANDVEDAGIISLAGFLGQVDTALSGCRMMRYEIEALISVEGGIGSYAVHPDWLGVYQDCLQLRRAEIALMGGAITAQEAALLAGTEADAAVRGAEAIARLSVYQTQLKLTLNHETRAQRELVNYYNSGGAGEDPNEIKPAAPAAPDVPSAPQ